jgi:hypothetical protein
MVPQASNHWLTETFSAEERGGRVKQSIAALVGMLLAAVAGAILNWPWWLEYVLIAPSAVWLIVSGRLVVYRQLSSRSGLSDRRVPVVLVVPVLLAAAIVTTRFSGLVVFVAFTVLLIFGRRREGQTPAIEKSSLSRS